LGAEPEARGEPSVFGGPFARKIEPERDTIRRFEFFSAKFGFAVGFV
jgi:hypothetical protein